MSVGLSLSILSLTNIALSQSNTDSSSSPQELKQAMISHTVSRVSVGRSENNSAESRKAEEGEFLNLGDIVRTGEDSVVRILFPDGTTETLCENTTYRVQESGSEIYREDDDANRRENIIAALTRCNIRPRFIERCRSGNGFTSRYSKAGERGKVGEQLQTQGQTQAQLTENQQNNEKRLSDSGVNSGREVDGDRFRGLNNSGRCTTGEELFTNYVFIPQNTEVSPKPTPRVPTPPTTPVTIPESGGSPVR